MLSVFFVGISGLVFIGLFLFLFKVSILFNKNNMGSTKRMGI